MKKSVVTQRIGNFRYAALVYCLCSAPMAFALDSITLKLGSIAGTGWQTDGVVAQLHWLRNNQIGLTLDIATLTLPELKKPLKNIKLTCKRTEYSLRKIVCARANLHLGGDLLDKPTVNLSFTYYFNSQRIRFRLSELALAGGKVSLQAKSAPSGWQAQLNINGLDFDKLLTQLGTLIDLPLDFSLGGSTRLKITATGDSEVRSVSIDGQTTGLSFSDAEGSLAGENMVVKIALKADRKNISSASVKKGGIKRGRRRRPSDFREREGVRTNGFQVQGKLTLNRGELLVDPVYVEIIKDEPVTMAVNLSWQPQRLSVHKVVLTHTNVITLQGTGEFALGDEWAIDTLSVESHKTSLKQLYTHYLHALLDDDSQLPGFEMTGVIKAALDWNKDNGHAVAWLDNINIEDSQKSFGLKGLRGKIQWHSSATHLPSHLGLSSAYFAEKIKLGASMIRANLSGNHIKLLAPWYQPILDGAIRIEQFSLANLGEENTSWQLRGKLYPISLSTLSAALDGPPLNGQISAKIPSVSYRNNHLEMGGELRMGVFGGSIVIDKLSLDNPFERIPELKAGIKVSKLNLKTLTDITEFGHIEGQLSGYVRDLYLINWQPVSFDAHFETPEDDTMPHNISQKAIKNLSSLGGGAAVDAISRSVLSIFENFSYKRIGLGCRLRNNVCKMSGAGSAPGGYYIIKGGGLPRINIIGYNKSVDWNVLITRLKRVTNLGDVTDNIGATVVTINGHGSKTP